MSPKDKQRLRRSLEQGLRHAHEKMLREKLMRGDTVIYSNSQGEPVATSPQDALAAMPRT